MFNVRNQSQYKVIALIGPLAKDDMTKEQWKDQILQIRDGTSIDKQSVCISDLLVVGPSTDLYRWVGRLPFSRTGFTSATSDSSAR
jgi:hypothetical protein